MSHFTYKGEVSSDQISQGDILAKTDDLMKVIREVHPYFASEEYLYFIVLTQSCDLVRRSKQASCKAPYISIAAVRSLESILEREYGEYGNSHLEKTLGVFPKPMESKMADFLRRLLNNNITEYFYLHNDLELGLQDNCVATLRVSIALKTEKHYNQCAEAKIAELTENFQAKLGWLVGNLYSRVGTVDWVPHAANKREFKELVEDVLNRQFLFLHRPGDYEKAIKNKLGEEQYSGLDRNQLQKEIEQITLPEKIDSVLSRILNIINKRDVLKEDVNIQDLNKILASDARLKSLIK